MNKNMYEQAMNALEEKNSWNRGTAELSEEQEEKYETYIKALDTLRKYHDVQPGVRAEQKKSHWKVAKRAAIFLICAALAFTVAVPNASAIRQKFQTFFSWEEDDHSVVRPSDAENTAGWQNYYSFENLPEGYAQTFAEEIGQNKTIVYEMADNSLVLEQTDSSAVLSIDSEETDFENMTIMGGDGRYYNNDNENVTTVVFLQGDSALTVYTSGKERMQGEELVRFINRNLIYTN